MSDQQKSNVGDAIQPENGAVRAGERSASERAKAAEASKETFKNVIEPGDAHLPASVENNDMEAIHKPRAEERRLSLDVPEKEAAKYIKIESRYYDPKDIKEPAFNDKGDKIETNKASAAVISSLIHIAKARGWDEIKVKGSEQFRRDVWLEAKAAGLDVKGYVPNEADKVALAAKEKEFRARETTDRERNLPELDESQKKQLSAAETFRKEPPESGLKKHPELAAAYAIQSAIEKRIEADQQKGLKLTDEQKQRLLTNTREAIAENLAKGRNPEMKIREEKVAEKTARPEKELAR